MNPDLLHFGRKMIRLDGAEDNSCAMLCITEVEFLKLFRESMVRLVWETTLCSEYPTQAVQDGHQ